MGGDFFNLHQMNIKLKKRNYWAIHDFTLLGDRTYIQGSKLEALYRLIQKRGEPIEHLDGHLHGVMALEFDKGSFVAMIHTPVKRDSFFPCKLQTAHIQHL